MTSPLNARARLREAGLVAKKSWGQHFLHDAQVLEDIVAAASLPPGAKVLELGAGLGALTHTLLAHGADVTAVERDRDLAPLLTAQLLPQAPAGAQLQVLEADAARLDYAALAAAAGEPLRVLGNLPYQISSRIMVSLADAGDHVVQATLLVQREVAERLAAPGGSRAFGLLSVLVQRRFAVRLVRRVPPGCFSPPPKVDSAVVHLTREAVPVWAQGQAGAGAPVAAATAERWLVAAARAAFSARRKVLANAVAQGLRVPVAAAQQAIVAAGLDPGCRAETLTLAAYAALGQALGQAGLLSTPAGDPTPAEHE